MLCEDHLAGHGRGVGDEGSAIWTISVLDRCKLAGTINGKDTKSTLLYARQEVLEEQLKFPTVFLARDYFCVSLDVDVGDLLVRTMVEAGRVSTTRPSCQGEQELALHTEYKDTTLIEPQSNAICKCLICHCLR